MCMVNKFINVDFDIEKIKEKLTLKLRSDFKKYIKYSVVILLTIILIRYIYLLYNFNFKYKSDENTKRYNVFIIRNIDKSSEKISYLAKYDSNNFILNIYKDKYEKEQISDDIFFGKYANFNYGDKIEFRGKLLIPEKLNNPYEFNYKNYLNSKNIIGIFSTYEVEKKSEDVGNVFFKIAYFFREDIGKNVDKKLPKEEAALFKSMIYGDDRELSKDIQEDFQKDGLSHILSVSGSNIATIIMLLFYFINPKKKIVKIIIYICIIYGFCIISAMELSIVRASLMAILGVIFQTINIKTSIYVKLLISFFFMFLYNPWCILNSGLLLSFFSFIGIIMYNVTISSFFEVKLMKFFDIINIDKNKFKYLCILNISKIFSLIISVYIFILPLQIYYFCEIQVLAIIFNVIISIFVFIESILGYISMFLTYVPYVSDYILNLNFLLLRIIIKLSELFAKFDFMIIKIPKPSLVMVYIYYFFIIVYYFKDRYLYKIAKKYRKNILNVFKLVLCIYIFTYAFQNIYTIYFEEYVWFFNVGQGNMAVIRKDRKIIVVDMGSTQKNLAQNVLNNFLKAKTLDKIDLVILTHMHEDHINGLEGISKNIKIDNVLYSKPKVEEEEVTEEFKQVKEIIEKYNISKIEVEEFDCIEYFNIKMNILSPPDNKEIESKDKINSNSLIILMSIKNKNYLFMGDSTIETEKALFERLNNLNDSQKNKINKDEIEYKFQNIEVLQVGHHGSKTSTSEEFLNKIKVQNCLISAKKEKFGHPHEETLNKLKQKNINIKITQIDGAIKF